MEVNSNKNTVTYTLCNITTAPPGDGPVHVHSEFPATASPPLPMSPLVTTRDMGGIHTPSEASAFDHCNRGDQIN